MKFEKLHLVLLLQIFVMFLLLYVVVLLTQNSDKSLSQSEVNSNTLYELTTDDREYFIELDKSIQSLDEYNEKNLEVISDLSTSLDSLNNTLIAKDSEINTLRNKLASQTTMTNTSDYESKYFALASQLNKNIEEFDLTKLTFNGSLISNDLDYYLSTNQVNESFEDGKDTVYLLSSGLIIRAESNSIISLVNNEDASIDIDGIRINQGDNFIEAVSILAQIFKQDISKSNTGTYGQFIINEEFGLTIYDNHENSDNNTATIGEISIYRRNLVID